MESKKEIKDQLGKFTSSEKEKLKYFIGALTSLSEKDYLDEDGLRGLDMLCAELEVFKIGYTWRLIRLLKLNHKIT